MIDHKGLLVTYQYQVYGGQKLVYLQIKMLKIQLWELGILSGDY